MGELIYLPAVAQGFFDEKSSNLNEIFEKLGFQGHCFNKKESPFFYPKFLISYYYGRQTPNLREKYGLKDIFISGDSGGFQNITQDAMLNPKDVIEWQQKNCDTGLILDVPPFEKIEGSSQFGKTTTKIFEKALDKTIVNAKIAMENWTNEKFQLFGVIQGDTIKRQEKWLKAMKLVEEETGKKFAGWSLSPKPSHDIQQIANHTANMIENDLLDKPIHILQISGFESLAMSAYVSKFFKSDVTVDSSTFSIGSIYFTYFSPYEFLEKWDYGRRATIDLKELACLCPVCQKIKHEHLTYDPWEFKSPPGTLISLHNLWQIIKYVKFLNALKNDDVKFKEFCKRHFGQKFINVCNYLDDIANLGKDNSLHKNVIKSNSLAQFMTDPTEESEDVNLKEKRMKEIKEEFPMIDDAGHNSIYNQRYE